MNFKKLIVAILIFIIALFSYGCSYSKENQQQLNPSVLTNSKDYFIELGDSNSGRFSFFCDKYTEVMYCVYREGYSGNFSVLYNVDGTPMTYDEWITLGNNKDNNN